MGSSAATSVWSANISEFPLGELGRPKVDDGAQEIRSETVYFVLCQELEKTGEDGEVRGIWDERRTGESEDRKRREERSKERRTHRPS
jgi:hypothetical protein